MISCIVVAPQVALKTIQVAQLHFAKLQLKKSATWAFQVPCNLGFSSCGGVQLEGFCCGGVQLGKLHSSCRCNYRRGLTK
jgi:hypothetical protein